MKDRDRLVELEKWLVCPDCGSERVQAEKEWVYRYDGNAEVADSYNVGVRCLDCGEMETPA